VSDYVKTQKVSLSFSSSGTITCLVNRRHWITYKMVQCNQKKQG
jgi:hypothetical protein